MIRSQVSAPSPSPRSFRVRTIARAFVTAGVGMPLEMQVRRSQNIEIRERHDQAVTDLRW
jgi:hypothetical protein